MMTITYILATVVLLGLCIFIHELGHLLGGKMVGIKARVFSIGFGKGVVKKKIGDTTYQLALIPFGGYCQFYGEDPREERKGEAFEFLTAHPLKRVVVVIMGPLFNLLFAIALFFVMNLAGYPTETNRVYFPDYLRSGEYVSPAFKAGIRDGDKILEINGKKINSFTDIRIEVLFSNGNPLKIKVDRNGDLREFDVKPKLYGEDGKYAIGIMPYGERVLIVSALEDDIASNAGVEKFDEIISVDGKIVKSPQDFTKYIRSRAGKEVRLQVLRSGNDVDINLKPRLRQLITIDKFRDKRFDKKTYNITIDRLDIVTKSIKNRKLKVNGNLITSFRELKSVFKKNRGKFVKIQNPGGIYSGICKYEEYGFIGVGTDISPQMIDVKYGIMDGFTRALVEPLEFITLNLKAFGMLFSGKLDVRENLRGPIQIAKIAGDVAYYKGISAFIILMAKISIILMIMNLLPIPAVDGSFIIFFLYETVRGKPINEKVLEKIQFVGIAILIILGTFVIFNDLSFFPFFQKLFN